MIFLKDFNDLHKLWFVLYKERNLLLTAKQKLRRNQRPMTGSEEFRYIKVKRSMAGIKHVLKERKKIDQILRSAATSEPPVMSSTTSVPPPQQQRFKN